MRTLSLLIAVLGRYMLVALHTVCCGLGSGGLSYTVRGLYRSRDRQIPVDCVFVYFMELPEIWVCCSAVSTGGDICRIQHFAGNLLHVQSNAGEVPQCDTGKGIENIENTSICNTLGVISLFKFLIDIHVDLVKQFWEFQEVLDLFWLCVLPVFIE